MNASAVEIIWSAIAAVGVGLTIWMVYDAWMDYLAIMRGVRGGYARARGARWWIAVGALVGNSMLCFVWLGFLLVGVIGMFLPPSTTADEQRAASALVGVTLICMEALLAASQIWGRIVRHKSVGRPHQPPAKVSP